jgi:uncharacterized protein
MMMRYGLIVSVFLALAISSFGGDFIRPVVKSLHFMEFPYATSAFMSFLDIIIFVALASIFGATPRELWRATGIATPWRAPVLLALLAFVPVTLAALPFLRINPELTAIDFGWLALGGPFIEEVVFRGLALGIFIRLCRMPFWLAVGLPALMFGLAHFANGEGLVNALSIVAVTGLGGLFFGWLYLRWGGSIWPPFLFHMGLNGLFQIFTLGDDATLGLVGNIVRLSIVAIGICLTIWGTKWLASIVGDPAPKSLTGNGTK